MILRHGSHKLAEQAQREPEPPVIARKPREFGAGRHLLAGIDVNALMAVSIDDMFADYMPEE